MKLLLVFLVLIPNSWGAGSDPQTVENAQGMMESTGFKSSGDPLRDLEEQKTKLKDQAAKEKNPDTKKQIQDAITQIEAAQKNLQAVLGKQSN